MVAMELADIETGKPMPELTRTLVAKASQKGLILLSCGVRGNVIRFLPALTIEQEVLEEGMNILAQCMNELLGG